MSGTIMGLSGSLPPALALALPCDTLIQFPEDRVH